MQFNDLKPSLQQKLTDLTTSLNIANELKEEELEQISKTVLDGLEEDELSMTDWLDDAHKAMELTDIKRSNKNFPFPGAANTKYPLITLAMLQFGARTLPELIKNGDVVKFKVYGSDQDGKKERRGHRLRAFLNWQILEQMPNWLDERDKLVNQMAVIGTCYTKTWYDPITGICKSQLMPYDLIKINDSVMSLEEAPRVSQYFYLTRNDLIKNMRYGLYRDMPVADLRDDSDPADKSFSEFVEQHCELNLLNEDEEELDQPYIVTIHKKSRKIVRIVARYTVDDIIVNDDKKIAAIQAQQYFADFHFIPSPKGRFHSIGFGTLLLDMNLTVNSLLNQIINCGTLSMTQGGIYNKDSGLRNEDFYVEPGEWVPADTPMGQKLEDSFMPFNYAPPNPVLFQLLDVMLRSGKELTSSTEVMTGMQDATNVSPNTLYSLIDQSEKVITANQRRILRGFKKELLLLYRLNSLYVQPEKYLGILDISEQEAQEVVQQGVVLDFQDKNVEVSPVADLSMSSQASRMARVTAGFQMFVQAQQAAPGVVDARAILRDAYKSLDYPNVEEIVPPAVPEKQDPQSIMLQSELDMKAKQLDIKAQELSLKERELAFKERESEAKSIKYLADAQAVSDSHKLSAYTKVLDSSLKEKEINLKESEMDFKKQETRRAKLEAEVKRREGTNGSE